MVGPVQIKNAKTALSSSRELSLQRTGLGRVTDPKMLADAVQVRKSEQLNTAIQETVSELCQQGNDLRRLVGIMLSSGISPVLKQCPVIIERCTNNRLLDTLSSGIGRCLHGRTVLTPTLYQLGSKLELGRDLWDENNPVQVAPFAAQLIAGTGRTAEVIIVNTLETDPKKALILRRSVRLNANGQIEEEDRKILSGKANDAIKAAVPQVRSAIQAIPAAEHAPTPVVLLSSRSDPALSRSVQSLATKGFAFSAEYVPPGAAIDRYIAAGVLSRSYSVDLNSEKLTEIAGRSLLVNGSITRITLSREVSAEELGEIEVDKTDKRRIVSVGGRKNPEKFIDGNGTIYVRCFDYPFVGNEHDISETIITMIPHAVAGQNESSLTPLSLHLSAFGYEDVPNIVFWQPLQSIGKVGGLDLITDSPEAIAHIAVQTQLPEAARGVRRADALWGIHPSEGASQMAVFPSNAPNAFFSPLNPHTVVFQNKLLRGYSIPPYRVGIHEETHLIDAATGWGLSGGALETLHSDLVKKNSKLFAYINENKFIPGTVGGGHSAQNSAELLSSLTNSLVILGDSRDLWDTKLKSMPVDVREDYKKALKALLKNIEAVAKTPEGVKIGITAQNEAASLIRSALEIMG
ncbi:MAG: hypothetical protein GYA55_06975 [SAR324 cluster bacterium]|uniref:Uncharacterized protein n=1 Tax=SAR324 cluster bacterium TaxID=2024889 RepID=A0A7X9FS53_9DELT|nr:hypothetical protein [SAR324 cluster bacterium]